LLLVVLLQEVLVADVGELALEVEPVGDLLLVPPERPAAEPGRERVLDRPAVAAEDVGAGPVVDPVGPEDPAGGGRQPRRGPGDGVVVVGPEPGAAVAEVVEAQRPTVPRRRPQGEQL